MIEDKIVKEIGRLNSQSDQREKKTDERMKEIINYLAFQSQIQKQILNELSTVKKLVQKQLNSENDLNGNA